MALIQNRKDLFHLNNNDKENNATQANVTTKKTNNFLIKKYAKATLKPVLKNLIQPTLDCLETQLFNNGKLHGLNQSIQDPALTKKLNAHKVKKILNFDKESMNTKKGQAEWFGQKDKPSMMTKGRLSTLDKQGLVKQSLNMETLRISCGLPQIEKGVYGHGPEGVYELSPENLLENEYEDVHVVEDVCEKVGRKERVPEKVMNFKKEANKTVRPYAGDIILSLKESDERSRPINCLNKHKISPALRTKMVDWMIEVMCSYKCLDSTFFLAISVMDHFFLKSEVVQSANDLHLIGVTSMFIASKYEEIYPMRLAVVHEKVAHKKLSIEEITKKEGEMLTALGFNLTYATIYDFITNVIFQLNLEETMTPELYAYLQKVCLYLSKADLHDYDLVNQYNNCQLAAGTLFVAFKVIEQLDNSFPLISLITQACEILEVDDEILYVCASKILCLAKNFEKIYSSFKNLKKFHFLGAPGELAGSEGANLLGGKLSANH